MCWHIIVSDIQYVSLTIWDSSASLTLQPQRRPKAGPIVEAPALLHFGRAPAHQLAASHHLVARGTALAVIHRHLPALHALTTRTCHPDPLLKTQLLTAGMKGEKGEEKEAEREGGDGGMGREEERRPFKEARLMEVMIQREKRWNWGKWVRDEVYRVCWQREPRHIQTQGEREKRDAVNTYFPSEIEKSSECRHRAAFCLILQPKHHLTSNPHAQNIRTQLPSHQNKPSVLHPEMLQSSTRSLDKIYSRILRSKQS